MRRGDQVGLDVIHQRRQSVGRRLFLAVLDWATERGADWLEWQASLDAMPFYEQLGYSGDPCPDPGHPSFEITLAPDPAGKRSAPP